MLNLKSERYNQRYQIIDCCTIGEYEYCLGFNPGAVSMYVTWACRDGNYYWGHYFKAIDKAYTDYYNRIKEEAESYEAKWKAETYRAPFEEGGDKE